MISCSEEPESDVRFHGCHPPFDALQKGAVTAYLLLGVFFVSLQAPLLSPFSVWNKIFMALYTVVVLSSIILYVLCLLYPSHDLRLEDPNACRPSARLERNTRWCPECQVYVTQDSKHCWNCSKCIVHFDHHCKWINNCVGARNYKLFATYLGTTFVAMATLAILALYFVFEAMIDYETFERRARYAYGPAPPALIAVLVGIVALIELVAAVPMTHLVGLHIYLLFTGQTTFQWIRFNREQRERNRMERISLGMDPGTPTCDTFARWRARRAKAAKEEEEERPPTPSHAKYSPRQGADADGETELSPEEEMKGKAFERTEITFAAGETELHEAL